MGSFVYCLHDFLSIRLIDASPADRDVVSKQLGFSPLESEEDSRSSDITIRFVDHLTHHALHLIGADDVAFDDDHFLILKSKHKSKARVHIPFDQIGSHPEILCERGLAAVPLLIAILNSTCLAKDVLPLHASAFTYEGRGIMTTGWSKGGKTEALLAFMEKGAKYIGDEWLYLKPGTHECFGIPEPIRVWQWHLDSMKAYQGRLSWKKRVRFSFLKNAYRVLNALIKDGARRRPWPLGLFCRVAPYLKKQLGFDIAPESLFGKEHCSRQGIAQILFLVSSHESNEFVVESLKAENVADMMLASLEEEQRHLMSYYRRYLFAYPNRRNPHIEGSVQAQKKLLSACFQGKTAYRVQHPYPFSPRELFDVMRPYCEPSTHLAEPGTGLAHV